MFGGVPAGNMRRFVNVPSKEVYEGLLCFVQTELNAAVEGDKETMLIKAKWKKAKLLGHAIRIRIIQEDGASTVELAFSYKRYYVFALAQILIVIALSLVVLAKVPFYGMNLLLTVPFVGAAIFLSLASYLKSVSSNSWSSINDFLLALTTERERKMSQEERRRWQTDLRRPEDLYKRLVDKYTKTWGSTKVMEYKLSQYTVAGLSKEEAIRKVAEEEGIF